jgi:hypothetical protein
METELAKEKGWDFVCEIHVGVLYGTFWLRAWVRLRMENVPGITTSSFASAWGKSTVSSRPQRIDCH